MTGISHSAILAFLVLFCFVTFFNVEIKTVTYGKWTVLHHTALQHFLQETWKVRGQVKDYGYFLSVVLFFVNGHHSLNQEAAGPSVNRDHNIWTTQKRKMCRAAVVRLCMISISIAISCLTTRCYSISHSGPFNVSGIEHEDAWFPLQTSLGHNGHRPVPTADNCVVVFLSVCGCVLCI